MGTMLELLSIALLVGAVMLITKYRNRPDRKLAREIRKCAKDIKLCFGYIRELEEQNAFMQTEIFVSRALLDREFRVFRRGTSYFAGNNYSQEVKDRGGLHASVSNITRQNEAGISKCRKALLRLNERWQWLKSQQVVEHDEVDTHDKILRRLEEADREIESLRKKLSKREEYREALLKRADQLLQKPAYRIPEPDKKPIKARVAAEFEEIDELLRAETEERSKRRA